MKNKKTTKVLNVKEYSKVLLEIKTQIITAQAQAFSSLNMLINQRNWIIGQIVTEKQLQHKWGSNFLNILAKDLQNLFPENSGLSKANIYRMMAFYKAYSNFRAAARKLETLPIFSLPWFHNVILLQRLKNPEESLWYADQALKQGWSRYRLEDQIKSNLFKRCGKAISNFTQVLPAPDSAMVQQSFKDPYLFDFLSLQDEHLEHDLEQGLIDNVEKMLLELGKGFALIGSQYHIEVDQKDYYIDLLFYHVNLKRYVVIELKAREFEPKDAGQINFYLSAIDDKLCDKNDQPTIGLILCKTKKNFTAEYALRNMRSPIGIAAYETEIINKLPKDLKSKLPTIAELEAEFEKTELLSSKKMRMKSTKVTETKRSTKKKITRKKK